jgi:hypothetical protein
MTATTEVDSVVPTFSCGFLYWLPNQNGSSRISKGGVGGKDTSSTVTEGFLTGEDKILSNLLLLMNTAIAVEDI